MYMIASTSFDEDATGGYTLKLSDNSATNSVQLSAASFSVNEGVNGNGLGSDGTGLRVINVTRSGSDVSGTATIDYATSNGSADKLKDYEQTLGTLVFGPNQATQSFTVLVPDDRFSESPETINITLSNPVRTTLTAPASATLTINSNPRDTTNSPSPVRWDANFNTGFYVRQQYLDFLNREPDVSGFQFWSNEINGCGADPICTEAKRVNVSGAFFVSIEFQETGYLVERVYKTAFADADGTAGGNPIKVPFVRLDSFIPDTQRIGQNVIVGVGDWQTQLENNKNAFALEFVLRPAFLNAFPLTMTADQIVDKMNVNAGNVLSPTERAQLIAQLLTNTNVAPGRA